MTSSSVLLLLNSHKRFIPLSIAHSVVNETKLAEYLG